MSNYYLISHWLIEAGKQALIVHHTHEPTARNLHLRWMSEALKEVEDLMEDTDDPVARLFKRAEKIDQGGDHDADS